MAKSHPWDVAKGFDHSAPMSALRAAADVHLSRATRLSLAVNGTVRQQTVLGDMIHDVPGIIAILSTLFELKAGDLIFTGTPAGVAALQLGDRFRAELERAAAKDDHAEEAKQPPDKPRHHIYPLPAPKPTCSAPVADRTRSQNQSSDEADLPLRAFSCAFRTENRCALFLEMP